MRYIRYAFWIVVAIVLIAVGLANREFVTLTLLPNALAQASGVNRSIGLPLFAVIFAGVAAGLLIGFVWEWMREHRQRAVARKREKHIKALEREVRQLRDEKHQGKDEVLATLEDAR